MENNITRIIIPAGIGDAYWIMVKMEAFCKKEGIVGKPSITLLAEPSVWDQARLRSIPFLEMIPFVTIGNLKWVSVYQSEHAYAIYESARTKYGPTVFPNFEGYDYFICYNGLINTGHYLEEDDLACNWYLPLRISESQEMARAECLTRHGKYAVFYFSNYTERILTHFSVDKIAESVNHFTFQSGLTPVFVGSWWDLRWIHLVELINAISGAVNLVGQTSLDEVFGIIRGAELVSGYHCGLTNIAIMFKKKTVLLWDYKTFPSVTPLAIAPPDTRMKTYIPLDVRNTTIDIYLRVMMELYGSSRKD